MNLRKKWVQFSLFFLLALGIATCGLPNLTQTKMQPLPVVSPVAPPQRPPWIEQISPVGNADPLNQILIRFKDPLIAVESLGSNTQQELLKYFEITPALPGEFRFLTPRMVGFQPEKALPTATRVQVKLKSGLKDLKNHQLSQDFLWTFNTESIRLSNLPATYQADQEPQFIDINPALNFTANVELDLQSLKDHIQLISVADNKTVPFKVELVPPTDPEVSPQEEFNPEIKTWQYQITPQKTLEKSTRYRLEFASGLKPIYGNLVSETPLVTEVETYSPLKLDRLELVGKPDAGGAYGRFTNGSPQLKFNNGILAESALENITIKPDPKSAPKLVQAYDNQPFVSLNPWALDPATQYTITLGKNLQDQYGQTLGETVTLSYKTEDLAGDLWAPSGLNIFPQNQDLNLNLSAVNLPESSYKAAYKVLQPADLVYYDSAYPRGEGTELLPPPESWETISISPEKNQPQEIAISLGEKLGNPTGLLAYGIQAKTNRYQDSGKEFWREPTYYGFVQLTNLGVFSQWFPEMGMIRVHHLEDGSPATVDVEIYQSQLDAKTRPQPQACATGKTDANGLLILTAQNLRNCMGGQRFDTPPNLLVIAKENQDWAFSRVEEYSGAYGYGIEAGWEQNQPQSRGTIFSDRSLYQPGETVSLAGVAYYLQAGTLQIDKNATYQLTLQHPDGTETNLGNQTTNQFGTFSLEIPLDSRHPLGSYFVKGKNSQGVEITGQFRVAEFKPPNFKVDLNLDKNFAKIGEKIQATTQSDYLFGAPVETGNLKYFVTRQKTEFTPSGWQEFNFGRQWFWPEQTPNVTTDVLQTQTPLSGAGTAQETITVSNDLPYPMIYRVDAEVTDVSNLAVANSQTFTALPSDRLIGLKTPWVADSGQDFSLEVIVTDPTGEAIAGERVRLELQKMDYSSVTQVVEGSRTPRDQVQYQTVATQDIRSSKQAQTVSLKASESGSYRIRANFANAKDEITATDVQIWISGTDAVYWGSRNEDQLEIKLDQDTYKPGDIATALIQSPYPEAELYFAVIRDKILYEQVATVTGSAPKIQFQVTPEMLPNAAVQAVLVRKGAPLTQVEAGTVENLMQVGFAPFKINLADQYLTLEIKPQKLETEPGAMETVQFHLTDAQGKPTPGQLTVMVVNEAILQLSGYRPPDLVSTVYAPQPISTRFNDNRPNVVLENLSSPLVKGWGYGGGVSAGSANTRLRTEFQPLAYYNASVITDNQGKATVSFKLPDDLTTWRVMAVASDGNFHFGNADTTFLTTKPLISNPLLPQFARPGDQFDLGVAITNNTGNTGQLKIEGSVSDQLQLTESNQLTAKAASGTQAYRFPVTATTPGESQVRFITRLNNREDDAFEVNLPVMAEAVTETVIETGSTPDRIMIPLNVDPQTPTDTGGLTLTLASTLIPEIMAPAQQVLNQEQLPFLEPTVSQLAIAANLEILGQKYSQSFAQFNPQQQASQALERLQTLQQADGGFASWPGQKQSDPFISAYAGDALAQAITAFPNQVDSTLITRFKTYLREIKANPGKYDFCKQQPCQSRVRLGALMALSALGETSNEFLGDIYSQRQNLDAVGQIKLARYLSRFPTWQAAAKTLSDEWQQAVTQTGRAATVNLPQQWGWLSSPTATHAETLSLAIEQNSQSAIIDRLLQGLLNQRRQGTWQSTYDNAMALKALVDYSNTQPTPPNFTATVKLGGKTLESMQFQGYQNPSQFLKIALAELPKGASELVLEKSGAGTLHYLVEYNYRLSGNQPGRFNGLRVDRTVQTVTDGKTLQRLDLGVPEKSLTLAPGQVFEIGLEIITDHPIDHLVIRDPLAAGLEAIDASFQTATPAVQAQANSWGIGYQSIHRHQVTAYADRLEAGVYHLNYLVRSVTPGTFSWPGSQVYLQYAPEEFGRGASSTVIVKS